jgi:hypothetical protein
MKNTTRRQVPGTGSDDPIATLRVALQWPNNMPAAVVAMTRGGVVAGSSADDPVFAAIERHRQATQAIEQYNEASPKVVDFSVRHTKAEIEREDAIVAALVEEEEHAGFTWLTTPPTTVAGILASLEYAGLEGVSLFEDGGTPKSAVCQFPRMIAEALRRLLKTESLDA